MCIEGDLRTLIIAVQKSSCRGHFPMPQTLWTASGLSPVSMSVACSTRTDYVSGLSELPFTFPHQSPISPAIRTPQSVLLNYAALVSPKASRRPCRSGPIPAAVHLPSVDSTSSPASLRQPPSSRTPAVVSCSLEAAWRAGPLTAAVSCSSAAFLSFVAQSWVPLATSSGGL